MTRSHRDEFPRKVRAQVFNRACGRCEGCRAKLKLGEGQVDHILPVVFGGEPMLDNAQLLCRVCHAEKTAGDIRSVRKADRQRDKHTGALRRSPPIQSRGFTPAPPQRTASRPLERTRP